MFGSGYNPARAAGYAKIEAENASKGWGEKIYPAPESFKKILGEGDSFNSNLWNKLMKESGAAEKLLKMRVEAAKELAEMPTKLSTLKIRATRNNGSSYFEEIEKYTIDFSNKEEFLKLAELVVLKKAQNLDKYDFWSDLYFEIRELAKINISVLTGEKSPVE